MSQVLGKTRLAYARSWHLVDLSTSPPLGRIATRIALTLMGKHKPTYSPSTDCGDYVVAVGCHDLHVTGKKMEQKKYYSHTTRPGSLKSMTMEGLVAKWGGSEVLRRAVRGMLPKNRLREPRMGRLKTFEGHAHPYRENLLQLGLAEKQKLGNMPQVQETLAQARTTGEVASA